MTQPRALYLAEILQSEPGAVADAAAEELRRLHSVNAELLEALKRTLDECIYPGAAISDIHATVSAAIAKAEEA